MTGRAGPGIVPRWVPDGPERWLSFLPAGEEVLESGDIIVAIAGTPIRSQAEVSRALRGRKRGDTVKVKLVRGDDRTEVVEVPVALK